MYWPGKKGWQERLILNVINASPKAHWYCWMSIELSGTEDLTASHDLRIDDPTPWLEKAVTKLVSIGESIKTGWLAPYSNT